MKKSLLVLATLALAAAASADPIKFARYPHVANGTLAFSYHGDIWLANQDGSSPTRLTAHVGARLVPALLARRQARSPSPATAWATTTCSSCRSPAASRGSSRSTRRPTRSCTGRPTASASSSRASRSTSPWRSPLYTVAVDGGLPAPMDMDAGDDRHGEAGRLDGRVQAQGRRLLAQGLQRATAPTTSGCRTCASKKITQLTDLDFKQFQDHVQDEYPMWGADGMIYFASERDGTSTSGGSRRPGGAPAQVTRHKDDGVQFPSISPDGKIIVYENELRPLDARRAERQAEEGHDRHGVRSEGQLRQLRAARRTRPTASRRRPTGTTSRSTSTARSSSSRPTPRSARRRRSRARRGASRTARSRPTDATSRTSPTSRRNRRSGCSIAPRARGRSSARTTR